jgi:hypothetical protein
METGAGGSTAGSPDGVSPAPVSRTAGPWPASRDEFGPAESDPAGPGEREDAGNALPEPEMIRHEAADQAMLELPRAS